MTWTLHISVRIPSGNEVMRWLKDKRTKGRYRRLRDEMSQAVIVLGRRIPRAKGKREVLATRIMGPRMRPYDAENLAMGFKGVLDAMVKSDLLIDDSPKWCSVEYAQERGSEAGARVEIWEAS